MKRWANILLFGFVVFFSQGQAQENYYGFGATGLFTTSDGSGVLFGAQLGGPIGAGFELRGTLDTVLIASNLGFDLLYPVALTTDVNGYFGGGADLRHILFVEFDSPSVFLGVHATAGLEYRFGSNGLFAEVQPVYVFDVNPFLIKTRAGLNFYF